MQGFTFLIKKQTKQAGAELCQAQIKLRVVKQALVLLPARLC
jgi:hypothetical protein